MHAVDIGVVVILALGFWRGRQGGLGLELYRLARIGLPVVGGCGLYALVSGLLSRVPLLGGEGGGLFGFAAGIGLTYALVWKTRAALKRKLESMFGDAKTSLAGVVGMFRGAIVALTLVTGIELSPADGLTESSLSGRVMSALVDHDDGGKAAMPTRGGASEQASGAE